MPDPHPGPAAPHSVYGVAHEVEGMVRVGPPPPPTSSAFLARLVHKWYCGSRKRGNKDARCPAVLSSRSSPSIW